MGWPDTVVPVVDCTWKVELDASLPQGLIGLSAAGLIKACGG